MPLHILQFLGSQYAIRIHLHEHISSGIEYIVFAWKILQLFTSKNTWDPNISQRCDDKLNTNPGIGNVFILRFKKTSTLVLFWYPGFGTCSITTSPRSTMISTIQGEIFANWGCLSIIDRGFDVKPA